MGVRPWPLKGLRLLESVGLRVCPPGYARTSSFGRRGASDSGPSVWLRRVLIGSWSEQSEWDITVVGRTRGQVPVTNLKRVAWSQDPASSHVGNALERHAHSAFGWSREKRMREGVGKLTPRRAGCALKRRKRNPGEHRTGRAVARTETDPLGEKSPGAAGHRGLLVLRAEERDVRNGMRVQASKGARLREGGKL